MAQMNFRRSRKKTVITLVSLGLTGVFLVTAATVLNSIDVYKRQVLTDDYLPYSFFFEGYMVQGAKTCGGVILHGEENIQTAKYGIHT